MGIFRGGEGGSRIYSRHAPIITPVIHEINNQLNPPLLRGRNHVIEALQAVGAGVDRRPLGRQVLEIDRAAAGLCRDVVEAPDAQDLVTGLRELVQRLVDVGVVRQEADPVAVRPREVLGLAVDVEEQAVGLGEVCRGGAGCCAGAAAAAGDRAG